MFRRMQSVSKLKIWGAEEEEEEPPAVRRRGRELM